MALFFPSFIVRGDLAIDEGLDGLAEELVLLLENRSGTGHGVRAFPANVAVVASA
jgi:hypothetical protein